MTKIRVGLLLVLAAPLVQAQQSSQTLSWEDCVALAMRKNPDLAAASWNVEAARASYQGSFNGLLPQVSLSNGYSNGSGFSGDNHWQAQAKASMDVLNAGKIADIKSAAARLAQDRANLRLASSNLRLNLRRAFTELLFSQTSIEVSRTILERRQRNAQLVALRYDSGRESRGNMLRSRAQALQAQTDLAAALRDLRTSQKSLQRRLGSDKFSVVTVTGTLQARTPEELPLDLQPLIEARPDITAQEAAVRSVEIGVSQARSVLWPNLSANYTRSLTGPNEFPNGRTSWSAGGQLNYPLFGGGPIAAYSAVSAAQKTLYSARENLRSLRDQAIVELEAAWADYAAAADQARVQTALLEAARQRNEEADIRYASGLLSYDNWEIIASDRINSERQNISAARNAVSAQATWEKALGKALGE
ncbi:MAG: hypothetical protein A3J74_08025 [Elusimicrobia bacterium RIFCSPHIGHO2_02_FULL_57_9]|nr:MAG: hypothetical protein A3J74_08025 [Elusimicrobia bacterium RIFCSPHIGHO2_02_FULL_57_9]